MAKNKKRNLGITVSLLLTFLFLHGTINAMEVVISKDQFLDNMKTALPKSICSEKGFFRKCFKVTENECIREAIKATKVCILSIKDQIPAQLHQPSDGEKWGAKLGQCTGNAYETNLIKVMIQSPDCKDPSKWKQ